MRDATIDLQRNRLLITNFRGSEQEADIHEPVNCAGLGRIRHFRRAASLGWPQNPLPIDPASRKLGIPEGDVILAQVFQNASCNWRCWYCFVPFDLLDANEKYSRWVSVSDLLDLYQQETDAPRVIDLSGGQPDLVPEWVPWMMAELARRGLDKTHYLWSDDNLSNDYFWTHLSRQDIQRIQQYANYGKVCCFKGYDPASFGFNTNAAPDLFDQQFDLMKRYVDLGLDVYAYATFTSADGDDIQSAMRRFIDRLQAIHPLLPLRLVPLEVRSFTPFKSRRLTSDHERALKIQWDAIQHWTTQLAERFTADQRRLSIVDVSLR